ncbi:hypothetical protein IQ256_15715 [cf. Phormidesmis sp. LEGE 11477]|nr:hypothetical protein [cf. Phormidesmis sp. LEGE 11477]
MGPAETDGPDVENGGLNQLHNLGNRAVSLGLIAGHGHHQGSYELIEQGEVVTLSPQEAIAYLEDLIASAPKTK